MLHQRPEGQGTVEVRLSVDGLEPRLRQEQVVLQGDRGTLILSDYFVQDATGRSLSGRMTVAGREVVYQFEDDAAVYPVEIDPLAWVQRQKLLAEDRASNDLLGRSVALSSDGTTALVGAPRASGEGEGRPGAVYVFTRDGEVWSQQAKLLASDTAGGEFGASVALSSDGSTALIGARFATDGEAMGSGAAYVFARDGETWSQQAKLLASDRKGHESLGESVALSADGSTALVGADNAPSPFPHQGAAYVFTRDGASWAQQVKLLASDGAAGDTLGASVSLSADGSIALVGAHSESDSGTQRHGAAYIFARDGEAWSQQAKLLASDKDHGDQFGFSTALSVDGSTALIGAPLKDGDRAGDGAGAAYLFTRSDATWSQQARLLPFERSGGDFFGHSVALSGDGSLALVGSGIEVSRTGAVSFFARAGTSWCQQDRLLASDRATGAAFGYSVALSSDGSTALVGSDYQSEGELTTNGAAYVFGLTPSEGSFCSRHEDCSSRLCLAGVCSAIACSGDIPARSEPRGSDSGCAVPPHGSASPGFPLTLALLAGLAARRRRSRAAVEHRA